MLSYRTSWIGNTYGGAKDEWVQDWVQAMYVTRDGTVFTNAFWDEGGREVGIYRDGRVVGMAAHTHGWGYTGGAAVTANSKYLFVAQSVHSEGGNLKDADTWPPKGRIWVGVSRRLRDDPKLGAPFPGGKGGAGDTLKSCFLKVAELAEGQNSSLTGLAANARRLFVSDPFSSAIRVYDADTMEALTAWRVKDPGALAAAEDGSVWAVSRSGSAGSYKVLHYAPTANSTPLPDSVDLPSGVKPTALCVDAHGNLWIADDGPDQNIKVFGRPHGGSTSAEPLALLRTFGVRGGVLAGPVPGRVGPMRFHDLSGVGVDGRGNIYVASGFGAAGDGVGTELECYTPQGRRRWRLLGLMFVDEAGADPAKHTEVFSKNKHFALDYNHNDPGGEWSYVAYTLDHFRYPQDPRLHVYPATVWVRNIRGRRFLYMVDMYSSFLAIYRFDPHGRSEIAIPCGYFSKEHLKAQPGKEEWPPHQPAAGEWIWRDANGNGAFDPSEFDGRSQQAPPAWGWWVDSRGTVWQATEQQGIRRFPLLGLDAHGSPIYSYASMRVEQAPPLFTNLQRAQYDADTDTMFCAGYTTEHPNERGYWGVIGTVLAAYPHWSKGNRTPAWTQEVVRTGPNGDRLPPKAFDVAGDCVFLVEVYDALVRVLNRHNGTWIGEIKPGPEVGGTSGWVDIPYGISAFRRSDGEYIILVEEDARAKNILYRWRRP
ncbi:MAG: hypothetical protein ACP5VE_11450 [Chthonomonadales bacterium]